MSDLEQLKAKVDELTRRHDAVGSTKSRLKGQLDAKKQELLELSQEIKAAGYDPKKLKEERDKVQSELKSMIKSFENDLVEVEQSMALFDKK
jgi:chromosome segregation ATPase